MSPEDKFEFKAEIKKLLYILSQSLYKHKEIFIRELVSNSADALKKLHFLTLQKTEIENPDLEKRIDIIVDAKEHLLTIRDTGIGMTKDDLVSSLGTIAGSGSEKFMEKIKESQEKSENGGVDLDIIGQFGVGFYSVFMVAEKVEVITKSYLKDEQSYRWVSDGSGEFTITEADKEERGTEIIIHLREEENDYKNQYQIESVIKKYSNFVPFPIYVTEIKEETEEETKEKTKQVLDADVIDDEDTEDETKTVDVEDSESLEEDEKEDDTPKPVNELRPIWGRNKNEITDEDYTNFYHFISKRFDNYRHVINYKVEGQIQFHSIIYIPETKSQDLMRPEAEHGFGLFSKNVMIMEKCQDLMPQWMRFAVGMVDSEDIPLNVSRDTIQSNRKMMKMETMLVKKFIKELESLAENEEEKYLKIWNEYGTFFKEGVVSDQIRKDKLLPLLRFKSSKTPHDKMIGLDTYIKNMAEDQTEIYYLVGENIDTMRLSPHLGYYNQKGYDVLLLNEVIDNFLMMNVPDYTTTIGEGDDAEDKLFKFTPIDVTEKDKSAEGDKKEGEDSKEEETKEEDIDLPEESKKFLEFVKETLGSKIIDSKMSKRLYSNAYRLANPAGGMTSSMQRAMRYWTQSNMGKDFQVPQKILEFNPDHPTVQGLVELYSKDPENGKLKPIINQLFENCLLAEGDLPNPSLMVPRLNQLIEMMITGKDDVENMAETMAPKEEPAGEKPSKEEPTKEEPTKEEGPKTEQES
ncbi:molecular chaperone HtpG [Candidatus Lokiarchaeum ossiferum]|uniref:molecular chaperone HtpG n=1 Tax=Candidatus Lokiarchaeum ossiferum TaxID=2951803 RepID=UPI00352EDF24